VSPLDSASPSAKEADTPGPISRLRPASRRRGRVACQIAPDPDRALPAQKHQCVRARCIQHGIGGHTERDLRYNHVALQEVGPLEAAGD